MDRVAAISIALGGAKLRLERFEAVERLSELFTFVVDGVSTDEIDFLGHLAKPAAIQVGEAGEVIRHFHGLLTEAALTHVDAAGSHYRLTLRPWFYLLDQNRDYRIFQDVSVVEIAKKVFADLDMKDVDFSKLAGAYPKREYCVQYKESDFQFLSRLFEEEGLYYYFRHEAAAQTTKACPTPCGTGGSGSPPGPRPRCACAASTSPSRSLRWRARSKPPASIPATRWRSMTTATISS
jgi:type VI secretion system secreted protein VgrG